MQVTRGKVLEGIGWSVVQSWGTKLTTFVLFVVLARLIPAEYFGVASASALVLYVISLVSDFGFGEAIVQRPELKDEDLTLPFVVSVLLSTVLGAAACIFSSSIADALDTPELAALLEISAIAAPLTALQAFQEALYRRHFDFKGLAARSMLANTVAGMAAVIFAAIWPSAWALVLQYILVAAIGAAWLWRKPYWTPSRAYDTAAFAAIARFGGNVLSSRLVDFVVTRSVEVAIVTRFGAAALGLYAVSARLYYTLLELLHGAFASVSLSALSKMSRDKQRLQASYLTVISLLATVASAGFILLSSVAPELVVVLFGARWRGAESLMAPLFVLGALQCVQFMNTSYLSATGNPRQALYVNVIKAVVTLSSLVFYGHDSPRSIVWTLLVAQIASSPYSFYATTSAIDVPISRVLRALAAPVFAIVVAYTVVYVVRDRWLDVADAWARLFLLGSTFAIAYVGCLVLVAKRHLQNLVASVRGRALADPEGPR